MLSKYGCSRAILAEILLAGSKAQRPFSRSSSISPRFLVCSENGVPLNLGKVDLKSVSFKASGQLLELGVPRILKILNI